MNYYNSVNQKLPKSKDPSLAFYLPKLKTCKSGKYSLTSNPPHQPLQKNVLIFKNQSANSTLDRGIIDICQTFSAQHYGFCATLTYNSRQKESFSRMHLPDIVNFLSLFNICV